MPAFSTHFIFAKEMMPSLKDTSLKKIDENAVFLGTQGPDVFFFHRVAPWMIGKSWRKVGSMLHRSKMEDILYSMADYYKKAEMNNTVLSYCYGFILHYALDRNCHPYVYSVQKKLTDKSEKINSHSAHNTIELSIDSYMLNERLNITKPESFRTADTINTNKRDIKDISELLSYVIKSVLNLNIDEKEVEFAFYDSKKGQSYLHDEIGIGTQLLKTAENIAAPLIRNFKISSMLRPKHLESAKKYANIYNGIWKSPYQDGERNESFLDLFNLAKIDALSMIKGFNQLLKGNEINYSITNNLSFLTGVEVK